MNHLINKQWQRWSLLLFITAFLTLQGCSHYAARSKNMRSHLKNGDPALALKEFNKLSQDSADKVLTYMNRGMLLRMVGDYEKSNKNLEIAKKEIEDLYGTSITQSIGSATLNDAVKDYKGDRYEQVLLHAIMALNYITLGDYDNARVEVLQADVKMREWGDTPFEDPFVRYLSGIIFEALGENDQAVVSYRKAIKAYTDTISQHGLRVPDQLKQDFINALAREGLNDELRLMEDRYSMQAEPASTNQGSIIAILNNGLGPVRSQHTIMTWAPTIGQRIKIALPTYKGKSSPPVKKARIALGDQRRTMESVENIDGMARSALEAEMPTITLRAIARMVVKEKAAKEAEKRGGGLLGALTKIGGMVSEIADTRNWSTLPQEIQLARINVAPGKYKLRFEILGRSGVIDSITRDVKVGAGEQVVVSENWITYKRK